jgi:flagellar basal-body rod modification protein FlgD
MDIDGVTNQILSDSPTTGPPEASQELTDEDFLSLLLTQLQFQDPLDPMEGVEMVNQIASLNQVEQLQSANQNLEALILGMASLNNANAVQLIDRDVLMVGDTFTAEGATAQIGYVLGDAADSVEVSVLDSTGTVVQSWTHGETDVGLTQLEFDQAEPGESYSVLVNATLEGAEVSAQAAVVGNVDGLDFSTGLVQLVVGDELIGLDEVLVVMPHNGESEAVAQATLAAELMQLAELMGVDREETP